MLITIFLLIKNGCVDTHMHVCLFIMCLCIISLVFNTFWCFYSDLYKPLEPI